MKRLTAEEMIKKLQEDDDEFLDDRMQEISTTAGSGAFSTPNAFSSPDESEESHLDRALRKTGSGYTAAVNKHLNTYKMWEVKSLGEATYRQFVKDESANPMTKVNTAIHQINSKLFEVEKIVRQGVRLKSETAVSKDSYWKSTQAKLGKIQERLTKLNNSIRKFGE